MAFFFLSVTPFPRVKEKDERFGEASTGVTWFHRSHGIWSTLKLKKERNVKTRQRMARELPIGTRITQTLS